MRRQGSRLSGTERPAVAGGMLNVNSGHGDHGGRPGNVLLAFEVQ